ncbi:MAG: HAMP domain-containing protein [Nitrospiraceae bacterium]|nr:MAG: HAMP domain-containing protein [Nitrospiraceae bacterium]
MNLKIWHKMSIGIAIPSLIAMVGVMLSYEYVNKVKNRQGFVQIADDLSEKVLEVRRNEKNFVLHKTEEYYKYCQDAISTFSNSVNSISAEIVVQVGKEDFSLLRNSIHTYSVFTHSLLQNYQQEAGLVEQVREEGRKLESFVAAEKHINHLSTDFILNLRRLEKNYMLFRDIDSFDRLNTALLELKSTKHICIECIQYISAISSLFSVYQKSDSLVNDLQVVGARLEEITNKLAASERQKISSFLTLTQRNLLIALILLLFLGPFFVYTTANYIVAPIKRLDDITRKITEGDLTQRAPIRERDETYSLALSFNKMLDHLQLTQESLEKSMELLREKQALLVESEKLASLGTLASGVAHELNNPLNNIYLATQTLYNELDIEHSPGIVKESVKDIFSQTLRVKRIVGDLLEFARGKGPELGRIRIIDIANKVLKRMTATGEIARVEYNIQAAEDTEIDADGLMLEQVFVNLFSNAVDAMSGEGSLNISIGPVDGSVRINISDTGRGISPENLLKVFDPFFTTKEKGTGLGLAIVYNIIKKHNGEIDVKSEVNKGTTFMITLPRQHGS